MKFYMMDKKFIFFTIFLIYHPFFLSYSKNNISKKSVFSNASKPSNSDSLSLARKAFARKLYFTSAEYLKIYIMEDKEINASVAQLLDAIIVKTNIFPFLDIPVELLSSISYSTHVPFVLGKKYFFKKDYASAVLYFKSIKKDSFFYLPAIQHAAGIYQILGDDEQSLSSIKECLKASRSKVKFKQEAIENRNEFIFDNCEQLQARHFYKFGKLENSNSFFSKIPINSYVFPQALMESSWLHFRLNDLRRAIGKNLSYQSPLLVDYFIPEAELVKVLSYIQLCQYEEAVAVIRHFESDIKQKVIEFAKEFNLEQNDRYQFARLFTDESLKARLGDTFFQRQLRVIWTRPGFQSIKYYLDRINTEKKSIDKIGSPMDRQAFARSYKNFIEFFNDFVKLKMVQMAKSIIKINNYFTEMELDLYTEIKNQLYAQKNKEKINKPAVMEVKNPTRASNQYYFIFNKEFWADELGGYVPAIDSACKSGDVYEKAIKNFET